MNKMNLAMDPKRKLDDADKKSKKRLVCKYITFNKIFILNLILTLLKVKLYYCTFSKIILIEIM